MLKRLCLILLLVASHNSLAMTLPTILPSGGLWITQEGPLNGLHSPQQHQQNATDVNSNNHLNLFRLSLEAAHYVQESFNLDLDLNGLLVLSGQILRAVASKHMFGVTNLTVGFHKESQTANTRTVELFVSKSNGDTESIPFSFWVISENTHPLVLNVLMTPIRKY